MELRWWSYACIYIYMIPYNLSCRSYKGWLAIIANHNIWCCPMPSVGSSYTIHWGSILQFQDQPNWTRTFNGPLDFWIVHFHEALNLCCFAKITWFSIFFCRSHFPNRWGIFGSTGANVRHRLAARCWLGLVYKVSHCFWLDGNYMVFVLRRL